MKLVSRLIVLHIDVCLSAFRKSFRMEVLVTVSGATYKSDNNHVKVIDNVRLVSIVSDHIVHSALARLSGDRRVTKET